MAPNGLTIEGYITGMSMIGWSTNKLERVAQSSLSAEIQQATPTMRCLQHTRAQWIHGDDAERDWSREGHNWRVCTTRHTTAALQTQA